MPLILESKHFLVAMMLLKKTLWTGSGCCQRSLDKKIMEKLSLSSIRT